MAQRRSGYERKSRDFYPTPAAATLAVIPHLPRADYIWEPAAGDGSMANVLGQEFEHVYASDIEEHPSLDKVQDFFNMVPQRFGEWVEESERSVLGIVTNPPFDRCQEFIEHAIELSQPTGGWVAMLLRIDFDSAKTRRHLFADNPIWAKKIVLNDRIVWFPEGGKSPSENHAWYLWDHRHDGPATIAYARLKK